MDDLLFLQNWYASQCDGDWEHGFGVRLTTLDNPGWHLTVELTGTDWEDATLPRTSNGDDPDESRWAYWWAEQGTFHAVASETQLTKILAAFRAFVVTHPV